MVHWRNNCAYEEAVKVRKETGLGIYSAQNRAGSYTPFGAVLLGCGANSIWNIGEKIAGWCTNDDESSSESSDVQRYKDQIDSILSVHSVGNISELGLLLESKKQELFDLREVYTNRRPKLIEQYNGMLASASDDQKERLQEAITRLERLQGEAQAKINALIADINKLERDCAAVEEYTEKLKNLEQDEYINSQVNENTKNFTSLLQELYKAQEKKDVTAIDELVNQITTAYAELGDNPPNHIRTAYEFLEDEIEAAERRKAAATDPAT